MISCHSRRYSWGVGGVPQFWFLLSFGQGRVSQHPRLLLQGCLAIPSAGWSHFPDWNNRGPALLLRAQDFPCKAQARPQDSSVCQFGHEGCSHSVFGRLSPGKQSCVARSLHSLVAHHQVTHKFKVIWVLTDESHGRNTKELTKPG